MKYCTNIFSILKYNTSLMFLFAFILLCSLTNGGMTEDKKKAELGHYLFFDKRLSSTETKSCASCHNPQYAFTDGYRRAIGIYGDIHNRNTPSLINISYQKYFNWANNDITSIESQMEAPLFGIHPIEMGLSENDERVLVRLSKDSTYLRLFAKAYPEYSHPINWRNIKESIAEYILTLNSFSSPYDKYIAGDSLAISKSAKLGAQLFLGEKLKCAYCHRPPTFAADSSLPISQQYANIGLYNYGEGDYPIYDQGLYAVTGNVDDKGKFKTPTVRNLFYTAPYFHDGSAETLEEALAVFENGGRDVAYGLWQGDGRKNPYKSLHIIVTTLSAIEKKNLLDFLESLSDSSIFHNEKFLSPKDKQ